MGGIVLDQLQHYRRVLDAKVELELARDAMMWRMRHSGEAAPVEQLPAYKEIVDRLLPAAAARVDAARDTLRVVTARADAFAPQADGAVAVKRGSPSLNPIIDFVGAVRVATRCGGSAESIRQAVQSEFSTCARGTRRSISTQLFICLCRCHRQANRLTPAPGHCRL